MKSLIILLLFTCNFVSANELTGSTLGKWTGYSTSIRSVYGDALITKKDITFSRLGVYKYTIVQVAEDSFLLKLNHAFSCGDYIRLGPLFSNFDDKYSGLIAADTLGRESPSGTVIEFSVYETLEKALSPKKDKSKGERLKYDAYCSWGIFIK